VSALLWVAPVLTPLVAACVATTSRSARPWTLIIGPLPALLLSMMGPPGAPPALRWVLLDTSLGLDVGMRILLGMTAFVWFVAGASARRIAATHPVFAVLFLLTMAGNLGLLLAADVVSFYVMFAWMTFSAYGLVVHDRTSSARRAGRVYVMLAVVGEVALLGGLVLAASHAGSTVITEVAASLASSSQRGLVIALLLIGFGVKVGLVPLHVWLPLAHPAAPVPASAVLSGTMLKAGMVGWLRLLPLDEVGLPGWGATLIVLGLLGAVAGVGIGSLQSDPKVLLAYSSVSQMGLISTAVGIGLAVPAAAGMTTLAAVTYAVHHGLAKAALFLGVGVRKAGGDARHHRWLLAGMTLASLSLAGAPLTSGWLAKQALKDTADLLPEAVAEPLTLTLSLTAGGTTVLMARLLWLIRQPVTEPDVDRTLLPPWALMVAAAMTVSWLLPALVPVVPMPETTPGALWDGFWPILVGVAVILGWAVWRRGRTRPVPTVPAGDALVLVERLTPTLQSAAGAVLDALRGAERWVRTLQDVGRRRVRPGARIDRIEAWLLRWRTAGTLFVLVGAALGVTLGLGAR
jgi:formate hydrogenlyase subunit 3/multisubunit Na+/H+ antiporter MnhD subunit